MEKSLIPGSGFAPGAGVLLAFALGACQVPPPEPRDSSVGHISSYTPPPAADIPRPVEVTSYLPPPKPAPPLETYTVVVNEVPVRELLFALARDAAINVDIHPEISGLITLNAVDQTLPQILERISRQIDLRYRIDDDNIVISPDTPFLRTYRVDYVNISRDTTSSVSVATQISTAGGGIQDISGGGSAVGGGGDNNSTTTVESESNNRFWETLTATVSAMVTGRLATETETGAGTAAGPSDQNPVVANREAGLLVVRATAREHDDVQAYIDQVMASARRQVLIEATIVEVQLNDSYQAGVDWEKIAQDAGLSVGQELLGAAFGDAPRFFLQYADSRNADGTPNGDVSFSVRLLKEFGDTRVLSSPKIMTLNNQTAVLKVVDNVVFFEVDADIEPGALNRDPIAVVDTTAKTVPIGLVMSVTPQINSADEVTLSVRPTITRVLGFVLDPNPNLAQAEVENPIPQIQVRELESVMRVGSGQTAVLGGLMQDSTSKDTDGVPVLSDIKQFGEFFKSRDNDFVKTELVIFLRPWVVRTPDVQADLRSFEPFLPENLSPARPIGRTYEVLPE